MPSNKLEQITKCPFCGAVWLFEDDNICHKCQKAIVQHKAKPTVLNDNYFKRF